MGLPVNNTLQVRTITDLPQVRELSNTLTELLDRARATRPDLVAAAMENRFYANQRRVEVDQITWRWRASKPGACARRAITCKT